MTNGDNEQPDTKASKVPQRRTLPLPSWLDGRTIAILTGMASLAAMMQTAHSGLGNDIHRLRGEMYEMRTELRQEMTQGLGRLRHEMRQEGTGLRHDLTTKIEKLRDELRTDIRNLDDRLRVVEIDVAAIRTHIIGFDVRPTHEKPSPETQ